MTFYNRLRMVLVAGRLNEALEFIKLRRDKTVLDSSIVHFFALKLRQRQRVPLAVSLLVMLQALSGRGVLK